MSLLSSLGRLAVRRLRPSSSSSGSGVVRRHDSWFTKYREPPNGFLFNQKPRKPGESMTARWEGWEPSFYAGLTVLSVCSLYSYIFRPYTEDLPTWARKEAEKRIAELDAAEAAAAVQ